MRQKNKFQKQRSFFVQLVLSNLLVALVCVGAMTAILLFTYGTSGQSQRRTAFSAAAQASARELSRMVESAQSIANNIVFVQQIRPFTYRQRPMKAIELVASLNTMKASNPFISDAYLYFYEDDYVYCSRNSQRVSDFAESIGQDLSPQSMLREQLSTYMRPVYRMHQGQLLIFYPYMSNYQSSGMLVFTLSPQTVRQLLPVITQPFSATLLYSEEALLGSPSYEQDTLDTIQKALETNSAGRLEAGESFSGFDGGYEVYGAQLSPELYYLRVATNSSPLRLLLSPRVYILLLFSCACAVALVAWYFARKNYQPVRALRDSMNSQQLVAAVGDYSEFDAFLAGYTGLQEQNRALSCELQEKYEMQQQQLLNALLTGNTSRYEDIKTQALDVGIDLDAACHLLLSVQGDQSLFLEGIRPLMDYRRRYTYSLHGAHDEMLYIIGCEDLPDSETLAYISNIAGMHITPPVSDISLLHTQYLSLRVASLVPVGTVPWLGGEDPVATLERYAGEIRHIAEALEDNDPTALRAVSIRLGEALQGGQLPFAAARYLCYEVMYHYRNYQENHAPLLRGRLLSPEALLAEAGNDTTRLAQALAGETQKLALQIETTHATAREPLEIGVILECVQQHFVEPTFSLQMVADSFNVSPSYLSAYFKENYGMKMLDYCTLLRMEKAKELLRTNIPLLEISHQTGYYNISSFIRRFKQMTGVTPGEYKKTLVE